MKEKVGIVFRLYPGTGVAPYRQLIEQVNKAISSHSLKPGDRLPPVRVVIKQITINPNTVYRAYRELEHQGAVETQWGVGTFVKTQIKDDEEPATAPMLAATLSSWIAGARTAGASDEEILELVRLRLRKAVEITHG